MKGHIVVWQCVAVVGSALQRVGDGCTKEEPQKAVYNMQGCIVVWQCVAVAGRVLQHVANSCAKKTAQNRY